MFRERGHPGLKMAARNNIHKRAGEDFDLVRPADGQLGSRVARGCALYLSDLRVDKSTLYTREGLYVVLSKRIIYKKLVAALSLH